MILRAFASGLILLGTAAIFAFTMAALGAGSAYIVVETATDRYIAGEGDDCIAAWQNAKLPAGAISVQCVR